ncbi:MAG: twin-arginine translocase subunit TatC [Armatimonadetes bacterium]|nr:twin-arginine translocase subunit TatC [Armatimonadota bacterium]
MEDREAELSEHLQELRARLIRSILYVGVGAVAAWFLYRWIYGFLTAPVSHILETINTKFLLTHVAEGFMIRCQISLIAGLILAAPLITFEIWGFVAPALTKEEKRPIRWIAPLCIVLFAFGVGTAYFILPAAMEFFLSPSFIPSGAEIRPSVATTIIFIAKMLLAFGIVFEMPIVLLFLGKLGIVNSKMLKSSWRYAVVAIAVVAAVATPSSDAFSMMAMAVPLIVLYAISILLVKLVEPKATRKR